MFRCSGCFYWGRIAFVVLAMFACIVVTSVPRAYAGPFAIVLPASALSPKPSASPTSTSSGEHSTFNIILGAVVLGVIGVLVSHAANRQNHLNVARQYATALAYERGRVLYTASYWANDSQADDSEKTAALSYYKTLSANWNAFVFQKAASSSEGPSQQGSGQEPHGQSDTTSPSASEAASLATVATAGDPCAQLNPKPDPSATPPATLTGSPTLFDQIVAPSVIPNKDYDALTVGELVASGRRFECSFKLPSKTLTSSITQACSGIGPPFSFGSVGTFAECASAAVNWGDAQLKALYTAAACKTLRRVWLPPAGTLQAYADATSSLPSPPVQTSGDIDQWATLDFGMLPRSPDCDNT